MLEKNSHIGVLGGGSWGTALVKLLSNNTENLHWWIRSEEIISHITNYGRNPYYLPHAELPVTLKMSHDINTVIEQSDIIIIAIPSAFIKNAVIRVKQDLIREKMFISAVKGIIPGEITTVTELLNSYYSVPDDRLGVISGPCHSEEVAMEKQSFLTIGSYNQELATTVKDLLSAWFMNISISTDVKGIEFASILKNIIAIASGISHGLGYGDNFQAVIISNAVHEMKQFLKAVDCNGRDLSLSVYLGDVMVTAYSKFSRNRMLGNMLGKGYSVRASLTEMKMVAEGYYAVESIMKVAAEKNLSMPVMKSVHNILYKNRSATEEFRELSGFLK